MIQTLEALRFRVTTPEPTVPEAINGAVITALIVPRLLQFGPFAA
jgi:hypothetical protein